MIRARNQPAASTFIGAMKETAAAAKAEGGEWEMRPGGMLVQRRTPDSESAVAAAAAAAAPTIRVKVKHEAASYEIYLSAQSTFGELRKLVAERTGVHHGDQKILYRDKERDPGAYLDAAGVRDKSKLLMLVDPSAHARRLLDLRRSSLLAKSSRALTDVASSVDRLASQVSVMEAAVSKGSKVADKDVLALTEQLMTQLIKLDGVVADGDTKLQRGMQARRIQKHVETLDALKIKNSKIAAPTTMQVKQQRRAPAAAAVVVTTEWEMFDTLLAPSASTTTSSSTSSSSTAPASQWQLL